MAKLEEAACLPRRRQNRRKHRSEQFSDGPPTATSFHATVFIPQTRSDVRTHHCADPYRWSDLSRCVRSFLRCDGEEQDHIHYHFWSARLVPCGSRVVISARACMGRTAARRANHRAEPVRLWRVTQLLELETSRCAAVPSRPNSSLVAAHYVRTWMDLRMCVDVLRYAMGKI